MLAPMFVALGLAGCAPVPLDAPKPVSRALVSDGSTMLQRIARTHTSDNPDGDSSLVTLEDGNIALGARLRLIERAERTLDLQYFLMKPDLGSALVLTALLDAADRGVRVRVLLDDVFTTMSDDALGLLDVHPGIEVRIFNPSPRPGWKAAGFVTDFNRVNRRMHNKSFVADGSWAIVGGRNIADEYFQIDTSSEFADFEMLVIGPAVQGISASFDHYWNDGWSVPIGQLQRDPSPEELAEVRANLVARLKPARNVYEGAVNDPFFKRLSAGQIPSFTGRVEVVVDDPAKLKVPVPEGQKILAQDLLTRMKNAKKRVVLLTPYFVPEDYGARLFSDLAERGVRVQIVTNSLGSTNHAYVHAGYRRHREALLAAGVELYEIRSDTPQALGLVPEGDETGLVMHTKLAVIDDDAVFVGSLNLDPRSIKQNTEFGTFVRSRAFAGAVWSALDNDLPLYTYRVVAGPDGDLLWYYDAPGAASVTDREPGATAWKNFVVGLTAFLGIEEQL
ncbi:phosphatidylserine/phosphatidylglycerophosphate/cardiolipin synthase family protein [Meridianimarinicoccus sp. MJW13]|uniref:phospholipase D-like domain-containing protein n=2 Tax=unclassified Meridianimarinicoccus TaxID=2923344 RepID=UPI001867C8A4|nr:phospholipase D family protein [Fluviibacterium sp. MJW13]